MIGPHVHKGPIRTHTNANLDPFVKHPPVWLFGPPPVMEAKHDGEGGGRQHLLVVVVVQAVSSCQGKPVANLGMRCKKSCLTIQQIIKYTALVVDDLTNTALHLLLT